MLYVQYVRRCLCDGDDDGCGGVYDDEYDAVQGVVEGDDGCLPDVVYMLVDPPQLIGMNMGIAGNCIFRNMDYKSSFLSSSCVYFPLHKLNYVLEL